MPKERMIKSQDQDQNAKEKGIKYQRSKSKFQNQEQLNSKDQN